MLRISVTSSLGFHSRKLQTLSARLVVALAAISIITFSACERRPPDPTRFESRIRLWNEIDKETPPPPSPIVFVGSSSILSWDLAQRFPELPVLNRGLGGAHISDINFHADRAVIAYAPSTIVFYGGDNDVSDRKSPKLVVDHFKQFVSRIQHSCNHTNIIFLSIKPSPSRWLSWPAMKEVNEQIRLFADSVEALTYVDMASLLLSADGVPDPDVFAEDGLHLNEEGYRRWSLALDPVLRRLETSGDTICNGL